MHESRLGLKKITKNEALDLISHMCMIRNFELQAEACYLEGLVAGFFHSYVGQEAIQVSAVHIFKPEGAWWITTYRCHALALMTGCSLVAGMGELFGNSLGCAGGKGGSMHFITDSMPLGQGIVGGHLPIAAGFAFASKYRNEKRPTICFLGDGAVAQGTFHESLNYAALWNLPIIYVIENNQWGMGTSTKRALSMKEIGPDMAKPYHIESYSVDGMDLLALLELFEKLKEKVLKEQRPIIVEAKTERFKGHSRSDTEKYRTKGEIECIKKMCPIQRFIRCLIEEGLLTEEEFKELNQKKKEEVLLAVEEAKKGALANPHLLETDVYAPNQRGD